MRKLDAIISISEIGKLFKECCKENGIRYTTEKYKKFLKFLEIDFYDWIKGNLRQFNTK